MMRSFTLNAIVISRPLSLPRDGSGVHSIEFFAEFCLHESESLRSFGQRLVLFPGRQRLFERVIGTFADDAISRSAVAPATGARVAAHLFASFIANADAWGFRAQPEHEFRNSKRHSCLPGRAGTLRRG